MRHGLLAALAFTIMGCTLTAPKFDNSLEHFQEFNKVARVSRFDHMISQRKKRRAPAQSELLANDSRNHLSANRPYIPGEKMTLTIQIKGISAGELTLKTSNLALMNDRLAFHFLAELKTNKFFSLFFPIHDRLELYLDSKELVPLISTLHIEEKSTLQERRTYFDWHSSHAYEWNNTLHVNHSVEQKKTDWILVPGSQSLMSTFFYLRSVDLWPGQTLSIPVTYDQKCANLKAETVRREVLQTPVGAKNTLLVKLERGPQGIFSKTTGESLLWFSDDEHKYLVQFEMNLKFGKLSGVLSNLQ